MQSRTIPSVLLACALVLASISIADAVDHPAEEIKSERQPRQSLVIKVQPRPEFPEELRKQTSDATVTLRAVFTASGEVIDVKFFGITPTDLPGNLIEDLSKRCKAAARKIQFQPAVRNGRYVSMSVELQYNFRVQ